MSIFRALDRMETTIASASKLPWPWKDTVLVEKDKMLDQITKIKASVPDEIKQARWVSKESQRILKEAQEKSDKIIAEAQARSKEILKASTEEGARLTSEHEIVLRAREKAEDMLKEADKKAQDTINAADRKAEDMLQRADQYSRKVTSEAEAGAEATTKAAEDYLRKIFMGMETETGRIHEAVKAARQQILPQKKLAE
ncbi:MAG: hypothetical protein M1269_07675 [Chloroflexi bacterium]|nr:hypothetical protein [Chloroflexota bacterium]